MATSIFKYGCHNSLQYMWVSSWAVTGWNGGDSSSADGEINQKDLTGDRVLGYFTWVLLVALCIAYGLKMLFYAHTSQGTRRFLNDHTPRLRFSTS